MRPRLSVLQLDTHFPRIAGDVAAPDTYTDAVEFVRVPGASVPNVVRSDPQGMDIAPFEAALKQARGEVIATSCGFLSYWQTHLQALDPRPFLSSSLIALPRLLDMFRPEAVLIMTFDAARLGRVHLGNDAFDVPVLGLRPDDVLRRAIETNATFDPARAEAEVTALARQNRREQTRHIVLECTNLPPYAHALRQATGCDVSSILTDIERLCPGLVRKAFL